MGQTCMFTATWPKGCRELAEKYIYQPMQVQIGSDDITTNKNIEQHIEICNNDDEKKKCLKRVIGYLPFEGTVLCFCNSKRKCRDLNWEIGEDKSLGVECAELHGDLSQPQRDEALNKFRQGEAR